jgi:DNA-binding PadR family transcriptional regulator
MPGTGCGAGDFDPRLFDVFNRMSEKLSQVHGAVGKLSGRHGPGFRGGPWDWGWGFGWPKGAKQWPGGGPWGRGWTVPAGPPGAARGPKASRGDVRAAILALLREGPRNGYQIMSEIEERSDGAWRPSPGAVYPALSQLADEGLIEGEESGGRRTFSLTDAGRRYVEDNPDMARGAWESMAQHQTGEIPGLFAQAARLGGSIVQMAHAGTPEQIHAAERLLEQTRRRLYQILADDDDDAADEDDAADDDDAADEQGEE